MESTVAQKLENLLALQAIDSKLDEILKVRGDLPEEVRDLEDEIAGYETRINKFKQEIAALKEEIAGYTASKKESDKLIQKYKDQQNNVRNNREFEAIAKEIETQELDIQIFEKRIKETNFRVDQKNAEIDAINGTLAERHKDLELKKSELDALMQETRVEESRLQDERAEAATHLDERLLFSYNRLRTNARNGLAVARVRRGACGGCFNMVPPQRQADIRDKKKIIVCEHCGRIMADVDNSEADIAKKIPAGGFPSMG